MKKAVVLLGHGSIRESANVEVRAMWAMMQAQLPELDIRGSFVEDRKSTRLNSSH